MAITGSYEVESGYSTTLKASISAVATSGIVLNSVLTSTKGVLNFDPETSREEWIGFDGITDNGDGTCTLTAAGVTRGLPLTGDTFTGSASRAYPHTGGTCKVIMVDYHSLFNLKANKDRENTFIADQTIGTGKKINFTDTNASIRRDGNDLKFKDPNQAEVTLANLANASGVNDKAKVSVSDTTTGYLGTKVTGGDGISTSIVNPAGNESLDIDIDLNDTTVFSETAVAGKVPKGGGTGPLDVSWIPTTSSLDQIGTANTTVADKEALSYAGNTRLNLADGNESLLNAPYLFAGIAKAASISGNSLQYTPPGPVVTIPAVSLASRQVARLWAGQTQATSNVTTDTISATTDWRAQTFTPSPGEDNVSTVSLNFTKASSPNGSSTVYIYATSGGLPTGAALATSTSVLNSAISSGANTFSFSTPLALTPGTVYALVWSSGISSGGTLAWDYQNTNPYASGQRCTSSNSGSSWSADATSDFRFQINYRGISGENAYLSDTAGALDLTPGTYSNKIGIFISTTQVCLTQSHKSLYATYSFSASSSDVTVDTEIVTGFRPRSVFAIVVGSSVNLVSISNGFWHHGLTGGISWTQTYTAAASQLTNSTTSAIGYVRYSSAALGETTLSVQAVSESSITIRRVQNDDANDAPGATVYLLIQE